MSEVIYCKDCVYSTCWRSGIAAEKFGKGMECRLDVLLCPDDYDFCSKAKKIIKCPKCNKRYDMLFNFCPDCGADMRDNPKGHWIIYGRILKCSECGGLDDWGEDTCPHCGADMEGIEYEKH